MSAKQSKEQVFQACRKALKSYQPNNTCRPKFKVGDKVIFTNPQGACFGEKTITGVEESRYGFRYYYTPSSSPWFASAEENFEPA